MRVCKVCKSINITKVNPDYCFDCWNKKRLPKPVRFCLQCKTKKLKLSQKKFCSQVCCIKARKRRGWFFGVPNFDGKVNCQSASRSWISTHKGIGTVPKGFN